jgi:hypothetical protein
MGDPSALISSGKKIAGKKINPDRLSEFSCLKSSCLNAFFCNRQKGEALFLLLFLLKSLCSITDAPAPPDAPAVDAFSLHES